MLNLPAPHVDRAAQIAAALASPAIPADAEALFGLQRIESLGPIDAAKLADTVLRSTGIVLTVPHAEIGWRNVGQTRAAVIAAHRFSAPKDATAEVVLLVERQPLTRRLIREAVEYLAWTLGLVIVTTRIPTGHHSGDIARRLGFAPCGYGHLDTGAPATIWRSDLLNFYSSRFCGTHAVPDDEAGLERALADALSNAPEAN